MHSSLVKKIIPATLVIFLLSACSGWVIQPLPMPTPFPPLANTPLIVSQTPVVIGFTSTPRISISTSTLTVTPFVGATNTPTATFTNSDVTLTPSTSTVSISVEVLGCNTSIDVTHGMGEVTNAFVKLKNTGNLELKNLIATLFALDEDRVHPDKTIEIASLPVGYEVTLKLTVDSRYKEETPVQVEVTGEGGLFQRVGTESCLDIGLFAPNPSGLYTPVPGNP